jgi:hypothetical protein
MLQVHLVLRCHKLVSCPSWFSWYSSEGFWNWLIHSPLRCLQPFMLDRVLDLGISRLLPYPS